MDFLFAGAKFVERLTDWHKGLLAAQSGKVMVRKAFRKVHLFSLAESDFRGFRLKIPGASSEGTPRSNFPRVPGAEPSRRVARHTIMESRLLYVLVGGFFLFAADVVFNDAAVTRWLGTLLGLN